MEKIFPVEDERQQDDADDEQENVEEDADEIVDVPKSESNFVKRVINRCKYRSIV